MQKKKNKVMLAAAIGMVAVIIGSTAVRCSIAHTVEESAQSEAQAPAESIVQDAYGADAAGTASATDKSEEIAKMLQGNVWQAEGREDHRVPRPLLRGERRIIGQAHRVRRQGGR